MQPSSGDTPTKSGNPWRRYGPLIAIVAVIAIIAGILIFASSGDDDNGNAAATTAASAGTTGAAGSGSSVAAGTTAAGGHGRHRRARSRFDQAQGAGARRHVPWTRVTRRPGGLKIPSYFAPECYANVDDNGGATATGVTADTITVVVYIAPDTDPVLDFITAAINNDDTGAQVKQTYQDYTDMIQRPVPDLRAQGRAQVPRRARARRRTPPRPAPTR